MELLNGLLAGKGLCRALGPEKKTLKAMVASFRFMVLLFHLRGAKFCDFVAANALFLGRLQNWLNLIPVSPLLKVFIMV